MLPMIRYYDPIQVKEMEGSRLNFLALPSLEAEITKLVIVRGDSHLGANCECETRAIAICRRLQPPSPPPMLRRSVNPKPTPLVAS